MDENEDRAERRRLEEDASRESNWKRWGPYLSERQWGTVREDYSPDGSAWEAFPHDHARSRAYRWGEDGLLGITDRECRLCFALALWNERDPILKERLFGLTNDEGNNGEDVKECYYYLDSTPTHSYMKALYKYPQAAYPYEAILAENAKRGRGEPEIEVEDLGVFDDGRYFDVLVEYAKASPDDVLVRVTVSNRGPEAARLHVLPTLWFRNSWSWGRSGEGYWAKPSIRRAGPAALAAEHETLGRYRLELLESEEEPECLFCENETNAERCFGAPPTTRYPKDAFHARVVDGDEGATNPDEVGTKAAFRLALEIPAGESRTLVLRLAPEGEPAGEPAPADAGAVFAARLAEADAFYAELAPPETAEERRRVVRQAYAGLLWTKQFYHYIVKDWTEGDPAQPAPPPDRAGGRNAEWQHLFNRDVLSVPDKWEYPWYAAWDLAFHMVPFADVDGHFARQQLVLFLREWYMHPNGQLPAYEWALSDVNPPVHAWAAWRAYVASGPDGERDRLFLERAFQKLMLNFTWWVNRKDPTGRHIFSGGFLGLDNVGVFDRSKPLPGGARLEQADGTAWVAFFCVTLLNMALELASKDPAYEDVASKFFEHFVAIVDAMNGPDGNGLWHEEDGFYYDRIVVDGGEPQLLRLRSIVGLVPLYAVLTLEEDVIERLPGFRKRLQWFLDNRADLAQHITYLELKEHGTHRHRLLALPSKERLERILRYVLDENEFLSPHGIRSLSRAHLAEPYVFRDGGDAEYRVVYSPGVGDTELFGGNSNWRGPVWMPNNYLMIEALRRYDHFFGHDFKVECPVGSGTMLTLAEVADELARRLSSLFLPGEDGRAPWMGESRRYVDDPHWRGLTLFHEFFDGDTGKGLGASHQTGWTALVAQLMRSGG